MFRSITSIAVVLLTIVAVPCYAASANERLQKRPLRFSTSC